MYKYHYIAYKQRIMMENIITKDCEIVIITPALCLLFTGYFCFLLYDLFSVPIKLKFIWIALLLSDQCETTTKAGQVF